MKQCTKCLQVKQYEEFSLDKRSRDGRTSRCKECVREAVRAYRATPEGGAAHRAASARYQATERGKIAHQQSVKKYNESDAGREAHRIHAARTRQLRPERVSARHAVEKAVRDGIFLPISVQRCTKCGRQATAYHHFNGYAEENWLDVEPLCDECHRKEDDRGR